jgi:hypothetical protein
MKRVLLWAGAIAIAIPGVVVYALDPRGLTYWLNVVALTPLGWLVLQAAARILPYRAQWVIATVLALIGPLAYLIWRDDQWWNYGAVLAMPFSLLATERASRLDNKPYNYGGGFDGPWGPP